MRYISLGVKHSDGRIEHGASGTSSAARAARSLDAQWHDIHLLDALGSLGTHLWAALVKVLWIAVAE